MLQSGGMMQQYGTPVMASYPTHQQNGYMGGHNAGANVRIDQLKPISLGQVNSFLLDASQAGKGTLDLSVGPPGKTLKHQVKGLGNQIFQVEFVPEEPVNHEVSVNFDDVHIPGSPFILQAPFIDASNIIVSGEGLVVAKVNEQSNFSINAARLPGNVQPTVTITGPDGSNVQPNVITTDRGSYRVSWAPRVAGDHEVRVSVAGREVPRSPFKVRVSDHNSVVVDVPSTAKIGQNTDVTVDVSQAGIGRLVVIISVDGANVANSVHQDGPSKYRFTFKPTVARTHDITVQFNGQDVRGSPFSCNVSGGPQNVFITDKQHVHHYGQPVEIEIDARNAGEGQIVAEVRSNSGGVPSDLAATLTRKVYSLSFMPKEGGDHLVTVTFNDENVPQSPMRAHVQGGPRPELNVSGANGSYTMRTDNYTAQPSFPPQHYATTTTSNELYDQQLSDAFYKQNSMHLMAPAPTYGPGSPTGGPGFHNEQITTQSHQLQSGPSSLSSNPAHDHQYSTMQRKEIVRTITYQPQYEAAQIDEETYFEINAHGLSSKDLNVKLEDPYGQDCQLKIRKNGDKLRYIFTPTETGKYQVYVDVDDTVLPGSPFTYFVQPGSGVKVTDVTEEGEVGDDMFFIVDTSKASRGDLDVEVSCSGQIVKTRKEPLGGGQFRYSYTPRQAGRHEIDVLYNYQPVPDCPIYVNVTDAPYRSLERSTSAYGVQTSGYETTRVSRVSGRGIESIPVSQQACFLLEMHGKNWRLSDIDVEVRAPNGELVPCKLHHGNKNEIRVEYETPFVGRHLVDIWCKGQKVTGSPYTVQVFDPKKVELEAMAKETYLHEQTEFEVVNEDAGSADMECRVVAPSGRIIPSHVLNTDRGMKIKYTPEEPGVYYVHTYIGGVEIPGSPMTQVVRAHTLQRSNHGGGGTRRREYRESVVKSRDEYDQPDSYGKITVYGDGLYKAEVEKPTSFLIDTHGMEGMPEVRIEGPHSVAKCNIEQQGPYLYKVTYIPVETGVYNVYVRWFGSEIEGSPFHPRVSSARKVRARGDWNVNLDKQQRMQLTVGEMKRMMFDVSEAGPGELKAEVRHVASGRLVPVSISEKDADHYYVDFVPDQEGDYLISINWTDTPIPNSPMRGFATDSMKVNVIAEANKQSSVAGGKSGKEFSSTTTKTVTKSGAKSGAGAHSKVVLSGTGLKEGIAGQMAEFFIDGSKATDGHPKVELKNARLQIIPIEMVSLGNKTYRCTYFPNDIGAHMLFVSWAGCDLLNSPYTVNIRDASEMMAINAANSASKMNTGQQSSFKQSSSSHQHSQQQHKVLEAEKEHPIMNGVVANAGQGAVGQQQSLMGQQGMSKHFSQVRRAKMTTSNSQNQNVGENMQLMIDAKMLAAGELIARCVGPTQNAKCELVAQENGMYALNVKPSEGGQHTLDVTYKGEHIEGSPFTFKVQGGNPPDPTKVKVSGPGVEHGILATFESRFFVDTEGAGPGNLSVKMRGPKGGFQASMRRLTQTSRTIECTYSPAEVGLYVIHVKWSSVDVPGSPFHVHIFDTYYELDQFRSTGILPSQLREQHVLQVNGPAASYQTSAFQTNTLKTLKKSKKNKKSSKKNAGYVVHPTQPLMVQAEPPAQYIVKEQQYASSLHEPVFVPPREEPVYIPQREAPVYVPQREAPVYVSQREAPVYVPPREAPRDSRDSNFIVAAPGKEIYNGGGEGGQSYRRSYQYSSRGGQTADYGTLGRGGSSYRQPYVVNEAPLYATLRR